MNLLLDQEVSDRMIRYLSSRLYQRGKDHLSKYRVYNTVFKSVSQIHFKPLSEKNVTSYPRASNSELSVETRMFLKALQNCCYW